MEEILFLTPEEVIVLHARAVELFGGESGLRDRGLLESATYAPQQTFDGEFLYPTIYAMAAALWHGLVKNHPFIDGNKRAGALATDVFLLVNGIEMLFDSDEIADLTLGIAEGRVTREALGDLIARRSRLVQRQSRHSG